MCIVGSWSGNMRIVVNIGSVFVCDWEKVKINTYFKQVFNSEQHLYRYDTYVSEIE